MATSNGGGVALIGAEPLVHQQGPAGSGILTPGGQQWFGNRVILRLLSAGRELRMLAGRTTHAAAAVRAMPASEDVQPRARASFIAAVREPGTESLDAVAGSEFIDDLIRRPE